MPPHTVSKPIIAAVPYTSRQSGGETGFSIPGELVWQWVERGEGESSALRLPCVTFKRNEKSSHELKRSTSVIGLVRR